MGQERWFCNKECWSCIQVEVIANIYIGDQDYPLFPVHSFWDHLFITVMTRYPCDAYLFINVKYSYSLKIFKTNTTGRKNVVYLKSNDRSLRQYVMNTCYHGRQNDTIYQISKFSIGMKLSTTAYACHVQKPTFQAHDPTIYIYIKKKKSQEFWPMFNPSTWKQESGGSLRSAGRTELLLGQPGWHRWTLSSKTTKQKIKTVG